MQLYLRLPGTPVPLASQHSFIIGVNSRKNCSSKKVIYQSSLSDESASQLFLRELNITSLTLGVGSDLISVGTAPVWPEKKSQCLKITEKKSHSILRAKRANFTFWVGNWKCQKWCNFLKLLEPYFPPIFYLIEIQIHQKSCSFLWNDVVQLTKLSFLLRDKQRQWANFDLGN